MKSQWSIFVGISLVACFLVGCGSSVPLLTITDKDVPYSKRFAMREGDAYRFQLPSGNAVAVWCQRPKFGGAGEQTTASGLKTVWGERPFHQPELLWKRQPDGSEVAAGWKSYIRQGSVITSGDRTSEYILYIDKWQFSIIEDLRAPHDLPVIVRVIEGHEP